MISVDNSPFIYILLEWQSSGSPPSAFRVPYNSFREQGDYSAANASESPDMNTYSDATEETNLSELDYEFSCFFLSSKRLDLYKSIDYRCEDMLLGTSGTGNT
jgi:tRNA dimethylallyltransferase